MLEATGSATQFFSKVEFWQAIEKGTSRFLLQVGKLYKASCKNAYSHPSDVIILGALHQNSPKQSGPVSPLKKEKGRKEKESNRRKQTRRKRKKKTRWNVPPVFRRMGPLPTAQSLCFCMHVHPPTPGPCLVINTYI